MSGHRHLFTVSLLLATGLALSACATAPKAAADRAEFKATNDPFEPTNRAVFEFNDFLDRLLIAPVAGLYRATVPPPLRDRISNILSNMSEPVVLANNLMQGDTKAAGITAKRFALNTTAGVGGFFEVANDYDLQRQHGDFGQTLHAWGAGSGPYIVLPLFGPSNIRDAVGLGVDSLLSPWRYVVAMGDSEIEGTYTVTSNAATGITRREEVLDAYETLRKGSLDFYAQMRSVYRQHRAKVLGESVYENVTFDDYDIAEKPAVIQ